MWCLSPCFRTFLLSCVHASMAPRYWRRLHNQFWLRFRCLSHQNDRPFFLKVFNVESVFQTRFLLPDKPILFFDRLVRTVGTDMRFQTEMRQWRSVTILLTGSRIHFSNHLNPHKINEHFFSSCVLILLSVQDTWHRAPTLSMTLFAKKLPVAQWLERQVVGSISVGDSAFFLRPAPVKNWIFRLSYWLWLPPRSVFKIPCLFLVFFMIKS